MTPVSSPRQIDLNDHSQDRADGPYLAESKISPEMKSNRCAQETCVGDDYAVLSW